MMEPYQLSYLCVSADVVWRSAVHNKNQQIISNNLIILFWEVQLVWAKPAPIPNLIQSYNCKWYEIEYFKKQKYFVYKM